MKKNKFKKPVITYDPIIQKKQPLWMHSIQTHRTSRTTPSDVIALVLIFAAIAVIWSILG